MLSLPVLSYCTAPCPHFMARVPYKQALLYYMYLYICIDNLDSAKLPILALFVLENCSCMHGFHFPITICQYVHKGNFNKTNPCLIFYTSYIYLLVWDFIQDLTVPYFSVFFFLSGCASNYVNNMHFSLLKTQSTTM